MDDLPYKAEYAKSSRSSCKGCKNPISKDVLRMAIMVQAPNFDGKMPLWHHFDCFFRKKQLASVGDVANYQTLRWEDQQRIKNKIVGGGSSGSSDATPTNNTSEKKSKKAKKADAAASDAKPEVGDFSVEYAKTGRSGCKICQQSIPKNEVRISKTVIDKRYGPQPAWHHVDCFVEKRDELGYIGAADELPGFDRLSNDDKDMLKGKIKAVGQGKKRKSDAEEPPKKKVKTVNKEEEEALAAQSKLIYGFRDKLATLSKKECILLLEHNNQGVPPGESRILDLLADIMAFGALEQCPECKEGQLRFKNGAYHCSGHLTEWTKCQYVTNTPNRVPFVVPDELTEYDFLSSYKYVKRDRVIPAEPEAPSVKASAVSAPRPLDNFRIAIVGELEKSPKEITDIVVALGGQVVKTVDSKLTCIISTRDEVDKNSKKIKNAEKHGVHVVSEKFLDDVKNGGAALMISQNLLSSWGGDPSVKVDSLSVKEKKKSKKNNDDAAKSSTVKVTVHGPAAVHPESGLQDCARVYETKGVVYDAVLNRCDISKGYNSYYKLQVLKSIHGSDFWLFRSWGRVGTTVGGDKVESFDFAEDAVSEFESQYLEKTGNKWTNRENFVKQPGGYYPVDIDYGQDVEELQAAKLKPGSNSSLEKAIQDLICLIFDIEAMKNAMLEFELDLKKMPLGKLSKKQVDKAYAVLTELQQIIEGDKSPTKLLDASNRFYTLIPHDFGMKKPPVLDTEDVIKTKIEMLDSLLEIEYAYNLMKGGADTNEDPVDKHYHQLKTDIKTLNKDSEEFEHIETYLKNTHAKTHDQYTLHLEEVFKIDRHGEYDRYKKYETLHNRKLLWHGSRITNYVGILSQGLRIAPPEAPCTGYMFGKGVYFADMVSKSANYCYTSRNSNTGLLMLCEVALGDMYERTHSEYVTKLPPNKHSTKGLGQTAPNPKGSITTSDGVEIPLGKPKQTNISNSSLLYNEYIIYDVEQVNIKYLLKVNFKYKF